MANPSKAKGDAMERECVQTLIQLAPDLCCEDPMRMLGAGRKDDIGDLRVFDGVTMQVKAYKNVPKGCRLAAMGAEEQRLRARHAFGVGLVPVPRALKNRPDRVRWLAVSLDWPDPLVGQLATTETFQAASFAKALAWLTDKDGDIPIDERVVELVMTGKPTLWIGPLQAWLSDYRMSLTAAAQQPAD